MAHPMSRSPSRTPVPPAAAVGLVLSLDEFVRQSPVAIAVIDPDGHYSHVSTAYCSLYGYRRDQLLGRPFTLIFAADARERLMHLHRAFLAGSNELNGEWRVQRQDGHVLTVISESVRVPGEDGRPQRLVYVVDISDQKRMALALQSSRQYLQSVLDGLQSHVCVLDGNGVIVTVNRAWRRFAQANGGASRRVLEGANYLDACERALQTALPSGAEAGLFRDRLLEVLAGRLPYFELEYPCHSATEQRWFLARVSRIEPSELPRIVVAHDNVTALKQAQETLRQGEALLLDLAASIPGAVFRLVNRAPGVWRFVYVSPGIETLFEVTPAQACGANSALTACILPEDLPAHDAAIREAVARHGRWEHEYRIRTRSGQVKWIHARAEPKPRLPHSPEVVWTGVLTDVSDRKHMEAVLKASEQTYRTLFETVPQGVIYHDRAGHITAANPAAQRILGLTLEQLQGRDAIDPRWQAVREDGSPFPGELLPAMVALRTGQPVTDVVIGVQAPGRGLVWLLVSATPVLHHDELQEVYASFEDITQRVQLSQELQRQASTDFLTGVANRRCLMERLEAEFQRVRRHPARPLSVLALDLDLFKQVNDRWGHAAGDAALQHVAQLMRQATRQVDLVGRSGGEEFALLLPDTDTGEALALADRLRARIAQTPAHHGGQPLPLSVSIGVSAVLPDDPDADAVLSRADRALYRAKQAGRNAVRLVTGRD